MAIRHLDSIMSIDRLNALQWTPGAGNPDGLSEKWYGIYDKVIDSGKSLWVMVCNGNVDDWITGSRKLLKRYGTRGIYLIYPEMTEKDAQKIMKEFC